jgi:hypothetical protein
MILLVRYSSRMAVFGHKSFHGGVVARGDVFFERFCSSAHRDETKQRRFQTSVNTLPITLSG